MEQKTQTRNHRTSSKQPCPFEQDTELFFGDNRSYPQVMQPKGRTLTSRCIQNQNPPNTQTDRQRHRRVHTYQPKDKDITKTCTREPSQKPRAHRPQDPALVPLYHTWPRSKVVQLSLAPPAFPYTYSPNPLTWSMSKLKLRYR